MEFIYSDHAKQNLIERRIPKNLIEETLTNPEELLDSNKERKIAQKNFGNRLLRVIYKQTPKIYIIITVYFTKVGRY